MLNLHSDLINNLLLNSLLDGLPEIWLDKLDISMKKDLISGFYNAGVLSINLSAFNRNNFYDRTIKGNFEQYANQLCEDMSPILLNSLRSLFIGFNENLTEYKIILNFEGRSTDDVPAVQHMLNVF